MLTINVQLQDSRKHTQYVISGIRQSSITFLNFSLCLDKDCLCLYIQSNNGSNFCSAGFQQFCRWYNIKHQRSRTYLLLITKFPFQYSKIITSDSLLTNKETENGFLKLLQTFKFYLFNLHR